MKKVMNLDEIVLNINNVDGEFYQSIDGKF